MSEIKELGEVAYGGYCQGSGGKSLVSGAELPLWDEQAPGIQQAWNLAAMAVVDYWRTAGDGEERLPDDAPLRHALVEQMGHRATVATIRETTFCGKQMIEVTSLETGAVCLAAPESLYQVTWLTRQQAEAATRTGSHSPKALSAANPNPWGDYGADDYPDEAERDDVLRMRREMAHEAGDDPAEADEASYHARRAAEADL